MTAASPGAVVAHIRIAVRPNPAIASETLSGKTCVVTVVDEVDGQPLLR